MVNESLDRMLLYQKRLEHKISSPTSKIGDVEGLVYNGLADSLRVIQKQGGRMVC